MINMNKETEENLLDYSKNKNFIMNILEGDQASFKKLETWFNKQTLKNATSKYENIIYDIILNGYNISKNKNIKIETLSKEKESNEFITNMSQNYNNDLYEQVLKTIDVNNKLCNEKLSLMEKNFTEIIIVTKDELEKVKIKEKETKEELEKVKIKEKETKEELEEKILKNRISIFEDKINDYKLSKNSVLLESIVDYTNKKIEFKNCKINNLVLLVNDLYSFRNIFIYSKITNVLLKRIIIKYKDDLEVGKDDKLTVKSNLTTLNYSTCLSLLIQFFFFVKKKTSSILHLLKTTKELVQDLNDKNSLNFEEVNLMKDSNTLLNDLEKNYTYQDLINSLERKIPLLLFSNQKDNGTKIEIEINNYINELNKIKHPINKNDLSKKVLELAKEKDSLENELKRAKFNNIEFKNHCNFILQEQKNLSKIDGLFEKAKFLAKSLSEFLKIKKNINSNYFNFHNFVTLFLNKYKLKDSVFEPNNACKTLLNDELTETADLFENDVDNFTQFYKDLYKSNL